MIGNITPAAGNFTTLEVSTDPVDANGVGGRAFTDGRYWGEMVIEYYITKKKQIELTSVASLLYPSY